MNRTYTGKKFKLNGHTYDSKQESKFHQKYMDQVVFHPEIKIPYQVHYEPDFKLGTDLLTGLPVYCELKEWFSSDMCHKYLSVVNCNKGMFLLIVTPKINERDRLKLIAHDRIDVIVTNFELPPRWTTRLDMVVEL